MKICMYTIMTLHSHSRFFPYIKAALLLLVTTSFLVGPEASRVRSHSSGQVSDTKVSILSKSREYNGHPSFAKASALASLKWLEVKRRAKESGRLQREVLLEAAPSKSRIVLVKDFGGDPTCQNDSTTALQMAINQAFNMTTSSTLTSGISDLGSVQLHLEGGDYLISKPLRFPDRGGGNLMIHGGSIIASSTFPSDGYLIELSASNVPSGRYPYENIIFRDLMLDCKLRGGGLQISSSLRTTVENLYVSHFTSDGILVQQGHETYISNSFLGQQMTAGGDPQERNFGGVGINLVSNDNVISNSVVFSAAVGIVVRGQANLLEGNHLYNKATGFGGIGIHVQLPGLTQTRIVACYLDFTAIVAEAPSQLEIADSFFLGDANIVLKSSKPAQSLKSVTIVDNMFSGNQNGVAIVSIDESSGKFPSMNNILVDHNTADGMELKSTRAKATLKGNFSTWKLDFSTRLLFPSNIQNVQYSVYCPGQAFPRHALRSVVNNTVTIETDTSVFGTVSVIVDQSSDSIVLGSNQQPAFDS